MRQPSENSMTTDQLINLLVADLKPVDRGRLPRALNIAVAAGAMMALAGVFMVSGPRPENFSGKYLNVELTKLVFTWSVVAITAAFLLRAARLGEIRRGLAAMVLIPFAAIALAAIAELASVHWSAWGSVVVGKTWVTCLLFIPLLAIDPFVAVVRALRIGASTDLAAAGAAAGLVAGGVSAMACSLPCLDDSFTSIAVWYGIMILICAAVGAKLGPRLLRW
jgi:hypothetical protein